MNRVETFRFLLVGVALVAVGLVVFGLAMPLVGAALATLLRLAVVVPLLYLGYSRYVLGEVLAAERAAYGPRRAEWRMAARVSASIGASVGVKLVAEPPVSYMLAAAYGQTAAFLSPLLADFVYGPLANYLVLAWLSRRSGRLHRAREEGQGRQNGFRLD